MKTRPEIERSFYEDKLYEYAYHAAVNYFYGSEEAIWDSSNGFRIFYDIQVERFLFPFSREDYEANNDIQDSLRLIGLDSNKFWEAIRYIHSMALIRNSEVVTVKPSVQERIQDLIKALSEEGTTITISRGGKKPEIIDDSSTKSFLSLFLEHEDSLFSALYLPDYTGETLLTNEGTKDLGLRWQIYDEYNAFQSIFKAYCTDQDLPKRVGGQDGSRDKALLISRILYFTKVVDDKKYLDSKDPLKSKITQCKNTPRPKIDHELCG